MESTEKQPSSYEELRTFHQEIEMLKKTDGRKEFEKLNPRELTEEDREIWGKYKNDTLTPKEFMRYRDEVVAGKNTSRQKFAAFLGDKLTPRWIEEDLPTGF